jgi:secreted trypsin-like serine protease
MWKAHSCTVVAVLVASIGMIEAGLAQQPITPFGRRIVGGERTDISQHPWQVALQFKGTFFCGGSIIGQKCILTAAHWERSHQHCDSLVGS